MASERWVPTLGYELAKVGGAIHVMKRGGLHVKERIPDDEVMLRSIAVAEGYDEAVRIIRALRGTLPTPTEAGQPTTEETNDG